MSACIDCKRLILFQKQDHKADLLFFVIAKKSIAKDSLKYCLIPKESSTEL